MNFGDPPLSRIRSSFDFRDRLNAVRNLNLYYWRSRLYLSSKDLFQLIRGKGTHQALLVSRPCLDSRV